MRGGDTSALRAYNERLIIGAIRRHGAQSKADLARATGLSAQAVSIIVDGLIGDRLLRKQPKVRGQVGQPFTPIALNPQGAFSVGLKIGRRSVEAVLVDFVGNVVADFAATYDAPLPEIVLPLGREGARRMLQACPVEERICGLGVAMPGDLPAWAGELDLAPGALDGWREIDVAAALREATGIDTSVYNDATAACAAEMALGSGAVRPNTLYVYLGTFVGGGLVLDGRLHRGPRGNAAAIGSMPMATLGADGKPHQLLHEASLIVLERQLAAAGIAARAALAAPDPPPNVAHLADHWLATAAPALARAAVAAAGVVEIEAVVLDGVAPPWLLERLRARLAEALDGFNRKGLAGFAVVNGSVGRPARVLGAALLPLHARYVPDPDALVSQPRHRPDGDAACQRVAT